MNLVSTTTTRKLPENVNKKVEPIKNQENVQLIQLFLSAINPELEQKKNKKLEIERKRKEKQLKENEIRNTIYRTYLVNKHPSYAFLRDFMPNRPM
jgi:hypothetical protein